MNATDLQTVAIDLQHRSYHIAIRGSLFDNPLSYTELPAASSALIVTNTTVGPLMRGFSENSSGILTALIWLPTVSTE